MPKLIMINNIGKVVSVWQVIRSSASLFLTVLGCVFYFASLAQPGNPTAQIGSNTNSLGISFAKIPAGSFLMGNEAPTPKLGGPGHIPNGDWDERPIHKVTISSEFYMSQTEVTEKQFQQFNPDFKSPTNGAPFATGSASLSVLSLAA